MTTPSFRAAPLSSAAAWLATAGRYIAAAVGDVLRWNGGLWL